MPACREQWRPLLKSVAFYDEVRGYRPWLLILKSVAFEAKVRGFGSMSTFAMRLLSCGAYSRYVEALRQEALGISGRID